MRNCLELIGIVATKEQLLELRDKKTSKERELCLASELEEKARRKVFQCEEKDYDVEMNKTKNKYSSTYIAVGSRLNIYKKCLLLKQGKPTASPSDQKLVDWNSVNAVSEAPDDNYTIDYFYDVVNGTQHAAGNIHVGNCAETNPNCPAKMVSKYQRHSSIRQQTLLVGLVSHLVILQIIKKKLQDKEQGQRQRIVTLAVMMTLMWAIIVQLQCQRQRT
jgi:hypothetical protein